MTRKFSRNIQGFINHILKLSEENLRFHILLIDIEMPEISGIQLA